MPLAAVYVQPGGDVLVDVIPWTISGTVREQNLYALTLALLVLGTLLCLLALRWRLLDVLAVGIAGAGGAGWVLSNGPGEGATLLVVQADNGLTVADLAVVPALLLGLVLAWRGLRLR